MILRSVQIHLLTLVATTGSGYDIDRCLAWPRWIAPPW